MPYKDLSKKYCADLYSPNTASGNTDILKFLLDNLENKKDVNVTDNINATPAHDAAEYGKIKTMLLLLKNGADISITDTVSNQLHEYTMA